MLLPVRLIDLPPGGSLSVGAKPRPSSGDPVLKKTGQPQPACRSEYFRDPVLMLMAFYSCCLPDLFAAAQRFRIASAIRLRAAADMVRRFFGAPTDFAELAVALLVVPGGLPRRLPRAEPPPPTPSRACIAASSLPRSSLSR
jgi:hypothetical protein